jgi:hypothetical protein
MDLFSSNDETQNGDGPETEGWEELAGALQIGIPVYLAPETIKLEGVTYTVYVRGWEDQKYIVTTPPEEGHIASLELSSGMAVTARMLSEGDAIGFRTRVLRILLQPYVLMLLQFPGTIATRHVRSHRRIPLLLLAQLTVSLDEDSAIHYPVAGLVKDLAMGGCCMECDDDMEVGTRLRISFVLPTGETVDGLPAEVMNRRDPGGHKSYGLKFTGEAGTSSLLHIQEFFLSGILDQVQ